MSRWAVLVAETRTGRVLGSLPFSRLSWSDSLDWTRGTSLSVTSRIETDTDAERLRGIARGAWRFSLVATYDERAIVAGPLVSHTVSPDGDEVEFTAAGPSALFGARVLLTPGFEHDPTNPAATVKLGPVSLAGIAAALVEIATSETGGELPLSLPDVAGFPPGENTREYLAADLATVGERLGQLSQVIDGPDLHLRPRVDLVAGLMWWDVRIGTPDLGQTGTDWTWTLGGNLGTIGVDSDASEQGMRAYVPGAAAIATTADGSGDAATPAPVGLAEDLSLVEVGWPLLARVDREHGTTERPETLAAHAADTVRVAARPVESWALTVRADMAPRLGEWTLGDRLTIRVAGHRWIEPGDYAHRVLAVSGDHTDAVTVEVTTTAGAV